MKKSRPIPVWALLLAVLVCVVGAILAHSEAFNLLDESFEPQMTVSAVQIKTIGAAVKAYEGKHSKRPDTLEQLVKVGMLDGSQLYDAERGKVACKLDEDEETKHFTPHPDVLYFPQVLSSDPPEMVLLCTLLLHDEDDKYQVITNDGKHHEMDRHELITALQRTYTHVGRVLREK